MSEAFRTDSSAVFCDYCPQWSALLLNLALKWRDGWKCAPSRYLRSLRPAERRLSRADKAPEDVMARIVSEKDKSHYFQ
eukprot:10057138-Alexandrium_andersonii.AAC.1